MFKQLEFDSFQNVFTIVAFVLIAGGFLVFVARALMMRKRKADRLAALPLKDNEKPRSKRNSSHEPGT